MAKERIAWHPAFASVVQIDLGRYGGQLEYETEHELNLMPPRIDLVVVRKDPALFIERGYASAFRGHNLMEFKSENDALTLNDLFKVVAYGCLYKAYGTNLGPVSHDDVTLTLVRRTKPMGLLHDVEKAGFAVAETEAGIYDMSGLIFPVRLVVTAEIDPDENLWLASLGTGVPEAQLRRLLEAAGMLDDTELRPLADAALEVVVRANSEALLRLKREDEAMMMTLREIMAPEIDKEIAQARLEASTEAAATYMRKGMLEGHLEGMREGRSEAERSIAENLVASGLLTLEQIAAATGLSLEEVRQIAAA